MVNVKTASYDNVTDLFLYHEDPRNLRGIYGRDIARILDKVRLHPSAIHRESTLSTGFDHHFRVLLVGHCAICIEHSVATNDEALGSSCLSEVPLISTASCIKHRRWRSLTTLRAFL